MNLVMIMKEKIKEYINENYSFNMPILTSDIKRAFPDVKEGTVRQILRRLKNEEFITQTGQGTFFIPKEVGILNKAQITTEQIIMKKYLVDENENIIGYEIGFNFANELSLTTQTSHILQIVSNKVADKRRKITINKRIITIEAPKIKITNENHKLLQVLDILSSFEKYSELELLEAKPKLLNYLKNVKIKTEILTEILSKYPIKTQLKFYKLGEINGITQT